MSTIVFFFNFCRIVLVNVPILVYVLSNNLYGSVELYNVFRDKNVSFNGAHIFG